MLLFLLAGSATAGPADLTVVTRKACDSYPCNTFVNSYRLTDRVGSPVGPVAVNLFANVLGYGWTSTGAVSPDGQYVAASVTDFDVFGTEKVVVADADGSSSRVVWEQPPGVDFVAADTLKFSPDGSMLLFSLVVVDNSEQRHTIATIDIDTEEYDVVVDAVDPGYVGGAAWSADGGSIVYTDISSAIVATLDGAVVRRYQPPAELDSVSRPQLSPDGEILSFTAWNETAGEGGLYLADLDSSDTQLARTDTVNAIWSKDGQDLIYSTSDETSSQLMQVDADGGTPTLLMEDESSPETMFWVQESYGEFADLIPPGRVSAFDAVLDGATDEALLRWDPAWDPRNADGSKGSGVAGYEVRYRRDGGSWSSWKTVDEAQIVLEDAEEEEEVDLEVKAFDVIGNVGESEDGEVVVPAPSTDDFFGPAVAASGELAEKDAGYVGAAEYDLTVEADDDEEGEGISSVAVFDESGDQIGSQAIGCGSGCPESADGTVTVDASELPEGETMLSVRAADGVNNRVVDDGVDLLVDHTPPTAASDIEVSRFNATTGVATVGWQDGIEPKLGQDLAGSGLGDALVRYRRDNVWSSWIESEDATVEVDGLVADEEFDLEVKSRDRVGNEASAASAELSAESSDGAGYAAAHTALSERTEVIGNSSVEITNCSVFFKSFFEKHFAPWYEGFEIGHTQIRSNMSYYCHNVDPRFDEIEFKVGLAMRVGDGHDAEDYEEVVEPYAYWTAPTIGQPGYVGHSNGPWVECTPRMGGEREYAGFGTIKYIDHQGLDVVREFDTGRGASFLWLNLGEQPRKATCPTSKVRRQRELAGWRSQRLYTDNGVKKASASKALRSALGPAPWKPTGVTHAWDAHHVVPMRQKGANDMRQLMFRCGIHANSLWNGVYLRGRGLHKDKPAYDLLEAHYPDPWVNDPADAAYHADTFGEKYVKRLRKKYLAPHLARNRETCDGSEDVLDAVYGGAGYDLEHSDFGIEQPGH